MSLRLLPLAMFTVVGAASCSPNFGYPDAGAPQPVGDALGYLDSLTGTLVIVDPDGGEGDSPEDQQRLRRIAVGEQPVWAASFPRPDLPGQQQIVVSDPAGEQFTIVRDAAGHSDVIDVGLPLQSLAVSDDGLFGLAFQPEDAEVSGSLLAFPNTVAIVNLHPDNQDSTTLQLGTGGARPVAAVFSAPLELQRSVAGNPVVDVGRLALVFVRGGLIAIDATAEEPGPFLPLTPDGDRAVVPAEVLFTNNAGDDIAGVVDGVERAFVRTNQGEVFVLGISYAGEQLSVALENVITPDAFVSDIELYFDAAGNSILLAAAGDELILVDGFNGVAERFTSPTEVDTLAHFVDPGTGRALALAYSAGDPDFRLLRIDPLRLQERRSTAIETLQLGSPVRRVDIGPDGSRAVLRYTSARDLGVLDLRAGGDVLDVRFASSPSAEALVDGGTRLLVVSYGYEDDRAHLAEVILQGTLGTREVALDDDAEAIGRVGDRIWIDHGGNGGNVTFFPEDRLDRAAAITFREFLLARALDNLAPEAAR